MPDTLSDPASADPVSKVGAQMAHSGPVLRLTMHACRWPDLKVQPKREHLRLRWNVTLPDGKMLLRKSATPYRDACVALLDKGIAPETLVTMRDADKTYDTVAPQPLGQIAIPWKRKKEADKERLSKLKAKQRLERQATKKADKN